MTESQFLSFLNQNDAFVGNASDERAIKLVNSGLQNISAAILPQFMINFYKKFGAIVLSGAYIFGPEELKNPKLSYPVPGIFDINNDIANLKQMRGKTLFGRNDLFLFAFNAFGQFFMLDNLTMSVLREYTDPWQAISDCTTIGKL